MEFGRLERGGTFALFAPHGFDWERMNSKARWKGTAGMI
jgi:hypothetical protein